ncbi:protein misato homolog 1 [Discoglossus pictus]
MAALCGEVITLQLGQYANSVGAQWWNLQDAALDHAANIGQHPELSSDVLYRRGVTLRGQETYTPRLIIMDLKGSVGSLRQEGLLYEDKDTMHITPAWKGNLTTHKEEPLAKAEFSTEQGAMLTDRDIDVRAMGDGVQKISFPDSSRKRCHKEAAGSAWSDYLRTPLHPKSMCVINPYNHSGVSEELESYSQGEAVMKEASYLDEVEDRLHFFSEECDYLQGFQILCDLHNGFSGVGAKLTELLHDEYPGRGILSWGTCPVVSGERDLHKDIYRMLNCTIGLVHLSSQSSLFCPLSLNSSMGRRPGPPVVLPQLLYNSEAQYHSSAVLAVALDTLSASFRRPSSPLLIGHLADALNFSGRKVVAASTCIPFPMGPSDSLADALLPHITSAPWSSLSGCGGEQGSFSQSVVLRGIGKEKQISSTPAGTSPRSALHTCDTGEDILRGYLQAMNPRTVSLSHLLHDPCWLGSSFPQFFSPYVTKDGFTQQELLTPPAVVDGVPVLATLQTATSLHRSLRGLHDEVKKVDLRRWPSFFSVGLEQEDFQEVLHELRSLAQCYTERDATDEESD